MRVVELRARRTHTTCAGACCERRCRRPMLAFDGDDLPTTIHLGLTVDARATTVVAVSTWLRRAVRRTGPRPRAVQLRGMATEPSMQGRGLGALLLAAGVRARPARTGAEVVWARARSTALAFYLANGFDAVGDEFIDATTGLPHVSCVVRT